MPSGKQSRRRRQEVQAAVPARKGTGRRRESRGSHPRRLHGREGVPSARSPRQASPKVLLGVAALLLAVGAAVTAVLVLARDDSSPTADVPSRGSLATSLPGGREVQRLFSGIPQNGNVLGRSSAPVTLVEYFDLQCPYCREFDAETLPTLVSRYVRTGKLRIESRPIAFLGPDSERGRAAAIAAADQGKLFNFTKLLYIHQGAENTGWLGEDLIAAAAASIPGFDVNSLLAMRDTPSVADQARHFDSQAAADHVTSTPTIFVGATGRRGRLVERASPTDWQTLAAAIDAALAR
jgi:protein-disulfide isomerase